MIWSFHGCVRTFICIEYVEYRRGAGMPGAWMIGWSAGTMRQNGRLEGWEIVVSEGA
jgi:hypothetical protein